MKSFLNFITLFLLLAQDTNAKASNSAAKATKASNSAAKVVVKDEPRVLSSFEMAGAGAFATAFGVVLVHPVDTIKTLQQSNEGIGLNMLAATNKIMKVRSQCKFTCS